jgi:3-oxoadipate enol-lactonase/4-carboxymuconolactone decarboxylase
MTVPRLRGTVTAAAPDQVATELLVLVASLGTTTAMWDGVVAQLGPLAPRLRILRVDVPGHGVSPATTEPFTIAELAAATLRLVDEVGGGRFHLAGHSLGGAVALELAVTSDRVLDLAMFCSGARIGTPEGWAERAGQARGSGTASLVTASAGRWFSPGYLDAHPDGPASRLLGELVDIDDESYALCTAALAEFDRTASLSAVGVPALIVAGEHDAVTSPESMRELAAALPQGRFAMIEGTSHLAVAEDPAATARLLAEFIAGSEVHAEDATHRGRRVRRAVLGDAHVDAAIARTTPETAAFQDFITRYAWGEIWSRPGLSRRDRSIATLASLVTGAHEHELRMHVRAALRNSLSRDEIAEVIMHTALYAGLPPANGGLAIAREVFAEVDAEVDAEGEADG